MSPSLFSNEYSRGPLYQYWKERGDEEKAQRSQRIQEAKLRSKGIRPTSQTYGPSSTEQYTSRATSGPPAYGLDNSTDVESKTIIGTPSISGADPEAEAEAEALPSYHTATGADIVDVGSRLDRHAAPDDNGPFISAEEEKAHLRQLDGQRRQVTDDAAIATTTSDIHDTEAECRSSSVSDGSAPMQESGPGNEKGERKSNRRERKKDTAGKIGRWLADAATGYTKKQERW